MTDLVGMQVRVQKTATPGPGWEYDLNPDDEKMIRDEFPNHVVRIWLPDTCGTMDLRADRMNVYINKTGLITKVKVG